MATTAILPAPQSRYLLLRGISLMVARAVPMHLLFQLACHTSEKLERA